MEDLYAQLVRDALEMLDRYRAPLASRDHVKSLDDGVELLRRVRAALEPLRFNGIERRDDVTEILRRIDEAHAGCPEPPPTFPLRESGSTSQPRGRPGADSK
jgi:hypothetical protein